MAIDFQQALDDFSIGGSTSDPISAIYDIIPTYSMYQQKLFLVFLCIKNVIIIKCYDSIKSIRHNIIFILTVPVYR